MKRSPPKSRSASASAVSVLPDARGPDEEEDALRRVCGLMPACAVAELLGDGADAVVLALDAACRGGPPVSRTLVRRPDHLADGDAGPAARRPGPPRRSSTSGWISGSVALGRGRARPDRRTASIAARASRSSSVLGGAIFLRRLQRPSPPLAPWLAAARSARRSAATRATSMSSSALCLDRDAPRRRSRERRSCRVRERVELAVSSATSVLGRGLC